MKRIWMYLSAYKKECVFAPLFKMLEALFELFVPLVVSAIIDTGIGNADKGYIVKMSLLLVTLAVIGLTCAITAQYFAAKAAVGCATGMRHHLFKHIQSLSFTEMDTIGTSTLITRMTSDINQVQNGVNLVLRLFLRSPFIVFGAMIMAFTIDVKAALVFAVAIPVLAVIVFGIMLSTRPLYKKVQAGLDKILGITRENLTGVRVVRAFNKQENEIREFKQANEQLNHLQKFVGKISGLMNPLTYVVVNISIIALIWIGAVRVNAGTVTQGQVVAQYGIQDQVEIDFNAEYVLLNLNGAVLFDSGKSEIKSEAYPLMDKIGKILQSYQQNMIEIEGHTDNVPFTHSSKYENNDVLSMYRALYVADYMRDITTIEPSHIKSSGRGEYVPIADNSTPEGRARNRRVEIKIYNSYYSEIN